MTGNVKPYALMAGVPAKQIGWVCECGQVLKKGGDDDQLFNCPDCGRAYHIESDELREIK